MITPFVYFWIYTGVFTALTVVSEIFGRFFCNEYSLHEEQEMALNLSLGFAIASFIASVIVCCLSVTFLSIFVAVIINVASFAFIVFKTLEKLEIIVL